VAVWLATTGCADQQNKDEEFEIIL